MRACLLTVFAIAACSGRAEPARVATPASPSSDARIALVPAPIDATVAAPAASDRLVAASPADVPAPTASRVPAVAATDGGYALQEAPDADNHCDDDRDCAAGGCAHFACVNATVAPEVYRDCDDAPALPPDHAACGCVRNTCVWWRAP